MDEEGRIDQRRDGRTSLKDLYGEEKRWTEKIRGTDLRPTSRSG